MRVVEPSYPMPVDARCIDCRYSLVGLPEPRCPECGRTFDPSDLQSFRNGARRSALVVLAAEMWRRHHRRVIKAGTWAGAVWLSWALFEWSEGTLSDFFWIPAAWLLFRRRWVGAALAVALSPAVVLLLIQCREYANGGGRYVRGECNNVETPQGSLKPDTRVRGFDPGCGTHSSNAWLRYWAEGEAIPIMHAIMGPPRGAYTGPYPTFEESLKALETGTVQVMSPELSGTVTAGGITVNPENDPGLFHWGSVVGKPDPAPVTAALYKQQCVIVRIPRDLRPPLAAIYLIDAATGRCFAVYYDADGKPQ